MRETRASAGSIQGSLHFFYLPRTVIFFPQPSTRGSDSILSTRSDRSTEPELDQGRLYAIPAPQQLPSRSRADHLSFETSRGDGCPAQPSTAASSPLTPQTNTSDPTPEQLGVRLHFDRFGLLPAGTNLGPFGRSRPTQPTPTAAATAIQATPHIPGAYQATPVMSQPSDARDNEIASLRAQLAEFSAQMWEFGRLRAHMAAEIEQL